MENNNGVNSKKTMGRRKIEIKKIEKKSSLQVTFTKRRMGLFRKASELSVLCGAEIAILVQSPADKIFSFGHPSVEALVDRFQNNGGGAFISQDQSASASTSYPLGRQIVPWARADDGRSKYEEAVRKLENEKRSIMKTEIDVDVMELHELEEYVEAMEVLRNNIMCRLEEMEKLKLQSDFTSTSNNDNGHYNHGVLPLQMINHQDFYGGKSEFEDLKAGVKEDDHTSAVVLQMEKGSVGGSCSSSDFTANRTDNDDDDAMINIYKDMLCFDENPMFHSDFL